MFATVLSSALLAGSGCGRAVLWLDSANNEFTHDCEALSAPDGELRVTAKHCYDYGPGYHYEYDLVEIEAGGVVYVARSYVSEPDEVHFLGKKVEGERVGLTPKDVDSESFQRAVRYIRGHGIARVNYLSLRDEGYVAVPP